MVVIYFEQHLNTFLAPKVWTCGLAIKNDLETSRSGSKRSRISLGADGEPQKFWREISDLVETERLESSAFEETLKQVCSVFFYFSWLGTANLVRNRQKRIEFKVIKISSDLT